MMKMLVVNRNKVVLILTMSAFLVLATIPVMATEFEIGTQFGISHLTLNDDDFSISSTYTRLPSGTFWDLGPSPTSLYVTWFPNKQFAISPEFSFGRISVSGKSQGEEESLSMITLHLGGRAAYFLRSHAVSSPYALGRVSYTMFSGEDDFIFDETHTATSIGAGLGYQWRIGPAFVLRAEGQYQRLLLTQDDEADNESANSFSLIIGIGTRFGNSNNQQ